MTIYGHSYPNSAPLTVDPGDIDRNSLLDRISIAAQGTVLIETRLPDGFQVFGDGAQPGRLYEMPEFLKRPDAGVDFVSGDGSDPGDNAEFVFFEQATRSGQQTPGRASERQPVVMENRSTGQTELAFDVYYVFNSFFASRDNLWRDQLGRSGQILIVRARLPESLARKIFYEVDQQPEVARDVAEHLLLNNGGFRTREEWEQSGSRPPYGQLSPDHRISIVYPEARPANAPPWQRRRFVTYTAGLQAA
jgi:hypothetical protein